MENEQIVPNGNIVTNSINEFNGVDDADDFFYKEGEENTNNDLTTAVEVDPKIFENVTPSEPLADNNVSTSESLSGIEPIIEPINFDNLNANIDNASSGNVSDSESTNITEDIGTENIGVENIGTDNIVTDIDPFKMPNDEATLENPVGEDISSSDIDKMISNADENPKPLDDSYVLANFDVLFDSLYNDVNGANNFISDLIEQKKNVNVNEANVSDMKNKLEKEKEEFDKFVETQKKAIELEKAQCNEYVKNQRIRLQNEEEQFNNDCEATRAELKLEEEKIKIANEKLDNERSQFEKTREIEEEKIRTDRNNLNTEKEQFEKEKEIALERIKQGQKELQSQKEQFAKTKELEEKKLELESKNLSQSCARFKELVSQFNSGFQQLPDNRN